MLCQWRTLEALESSFVEYIAGTPSSVSASIRTIPVMHRAVQRVKEPVMLAEEELEFDGDLLSFSIH